MNVVGIIAEFNPFHQGHAYLMERAKEITGSDYAVVIMNGDFVQRGEPAIFNKYERTRAALEGGADLVFELPVRFGISSAGDFALGGVSALTALGFVTHLAFGSECGDILPLQQAAAALLEESADFLSVLTRDLQNGFSYAAARAHALSETASLDPALMSQPNNILGTEYCLALKKLSSPLVPVTIPRKGMDYHDTFGRPDSTTGDCPADGQVPEDTELPSATALRYKIYENDTPHLTLDDFSSALGYALLQSDDLTRYKDISPDLADRIRRYLPDHHTACELVDQCRTRAFTDGRIRRGLMQCLLRIEHTDMELPYLRLLGIRQGSSAEGESPNKRKGVGSLLSQVPDSCHILSRLATDIKALDADALTLFRQDLFAADLYRQVWNRKYHVTLPNEYQHSPVIVRS